MISIEALKEYGADTEEGLARCMGMEDFYLRLVGTMLENENFEKLEAAVEAGDAKTGFAAAHALKGALSNLSLTPLCEPVIEITERLRGKEEMPDLSDLMPLYREQLEKLRALQ